MDHTAVQRGPDDGSLVQGLRRREESAFVALVKAHHASLKSLVRFYVPDDYVAEEVVQETWLAVLKGVDGFEGRASLKTWISGIAMNIARTRGVREKRTVAFSDYATRELGQPESAVDPDRFQGAGGDYPGHWSVAPRSWSIDPEDNYLRQETVTLVSNAMAALPEAQRLVMTLRDGQGWTADEVCEALGLTEVNQRVLLHRARSKVRTVLELHFENTRRPS